MCKAGQHIDVYKRQADSKTYRMLHADGTPQLDANNGQQADFDNLLILFLSLIHIYGIAVRRAEAG